MTCPAPANNGHKMRTAALLRALASEGHQTTLLAFADPAEIASAPFVRLSELAASYELIPLKMQNQMSKSGIARRALSLLFSRPFYIRRFSSRAMQARIGHHLSASKFDAVLCDTVY